MRDDKFDWNKLREERRGGLTGIDPETTSLTGITSEKRGEEV